MLSRPAAAIIFLLASLNIGSVAQDKNTAFAGIPLRRLRRPKWLPALLSRVLLPPAVMALFFKT